MSASNLQRNFIAVCLFGLIAVPLPCPAATKPNVLFILVDDLSWSDVTCYGSKVYETPNVDRLAREGMRFTDFYSAGPVCSPTRASILTGKSPARTGITTWLYTPEKDAPYVTHHLPLAEQTIAETFRQHGYSTGYIGKWHLGYKSEHWAAHQGFEFAVGGIDSEHAWALAHPDLPSPYKKGHTRFFSPHHFTQMKNGPEGEYLTDRLTDETIRFIEANKKGPFLAYLSFHTVHTPLEAKPEIVERYRQKIVSLKLDQKKEPNRRLKQFQNNPNYAAMVHHMDENIGRLLAGLKNMGLEKNTIVVFTSDNGGKGSVTSNLPLNGAKHDLREGGIRVPTIVRWPGRISAGSENDCPLISNDFYPTLLDLAKLPLKPQQHVDGVSFKKILLGKAESVERSDLYWHYPHSRQEAAIRSGDYKLIHFFEKNEVVLYNLKNDIGELNDLSAAQPERAEKMLSRLQTWQKKVGARFAERAK